jgi:AbrB family looped-hinge helix DNA binding protein
MTHKTQKPLKDKYVLQVGNRGRINLPSEFRKRLGIEEGDRILLTIEEDGSAKLVSMRKQVEKVQGMLKHLSPDRSWADELIKERRAEAERE